jgi:MFS family permease
MAALTSRLRVEATVLTTNTRDVRTRTRHLGDNFARRWRVIVACFCGLVVGTGSILTFSFGVFLKPVTEDLGISRGELSTAFAIGVMLTALASPVVGWLVDRWGARRILVPGIFLFALAVACFGLMQAQPLFLVFVIFAIVGFVGGVQSPVPYAAVVLQWFSREPGIALGLTMAGSGLGVALVPQFAAYLNHRLGWREAYFGLAISVLLLAWLPVAIFVREPPEARTFGSDGVRRLAALPGIDAAAAFRARNFWLLTGAVFLSVLGINGTLVHLVALLTDRGFPLQMATAALSAAGIAIIVGRIVCGWCLDRFWGPYVAICFCILPMAGTALLGFGQGHPIPFVGAALCGAGVGAELVLMPFFINRYFGLRAYGKIYGLMFMLFTIASGLGPALSGRAFDTYHSYSQVFIAYEAAPVTACVLFVRLGQYTYPAAAQPASFGLNAT